MARGAFFRENMDRPKNNFPVRCLSLRESRNFAEREATIIIGPPRSAGARKTARPVQAGACRRRRFAENCGAGRCKTRRLYEP